MPKTIRQTLLWKLQASPQLAELREDMMALTGVRLRLVGVTACSDALNEPCGESLLCERVRAAPSGREHCRRFSEALILASKQGEQYDDRCDAGLTEFCVPLKIWGDTLGYLLAGGYRVGTFDLSSQNRMSHLLQRLGVDETAAIVEMKEDTHAVTKAEFAAMKRWLQLAADGLVRSLDFHKDSIQRTLPGFVTKICAMIQQDYQSPPSLAEAAAMCDLSEGYFCRAFHESTGLRYVEYVQAVRIEHVCYALRNSDVSITDVAFNSGFESISQFNRVFRKHMNQTPREWRRGQRLLNA